MWVVIEIHRKRTQIQLNKNDSRPIRNLQWVFKATTTLCELYLYVFIYMALETQSLVISKLLHFLRLQHHGIISMRPEAPLSTNRITVVKCTCVSRSWCGTVGPHTVHIPERLCTVYFLSWLPSFKFVWTGYAKTEWTDSLPLQGSNCSVKIQLVEGTTLHQR
jgi:hypothetical protein